MSPDQDSTRLTRLPRYLLTALKCREQDALARAGKRPSEVQAIRVIRPGALPLTPPPSRIDLKRHYSTGPNRYMN